MGHFFNRLDPSPKTTATAAARVRGLSAQDLPRVVDIHRGCQKLMTYPPIAVLDLCRRPDVVFTVVVDRGYVQGFTALRRVAEFADWEIIVMGVAPAQRRKGYGRTLVEHAKGLIDAIHPHLRVRLPETELNALCFFRALGFQAIVPTEWGIGPQGCDLITMKWPSFA